MQTEERVFCIGRLDADSTGLIIPTNDSELANRLTHPRYGLMKTYVVSVKGEIGGETVEKLKKGIWLSKGKNKQGIGKDIEAQLRRVIDRSWYPAGTEPSSSASVGESEFAG